MKIKENPVWISCHIYTTETDTLLVRAVGPLVRRLTDQQLIQRFFFIRYDDKRGQHIRLRLLPASAAMRPAVRRHVKAAFPEAVSVAYTPETTRYGGPGGIKLAERLFNASSLAVLRLLADSPAWNYRRAMASALQMQIGMVQALGVSRTEATALLSHIAGTQAPQQSAASFEEGFAAQREVIVPPLSGLWKACEQDIDFVDAWFAEWRQSIRELTEDLTAAYRAGQLVLPESKQHDSPLWALYESYIHMTNNRLGVFRPDETFGAYLLYRSLESD